MNAPTFLRSVGLLGAAAAVLALANCAPTGGHYGGGPVTGPGIIAPPKPKPKPPVGPGNILPVPPKPKPPIGPGTIIPPKPKPKPPIWGPGIIKPVPPKPVPPVVGPGKIKIPTPPAGGKKYKMPIPKPPKVNNRIKF